MGNSLRHSDVLIIGSGPSASAAAIRCAYHGFSVQILKTATQIPKAVQPSESVHPGISGLLDMLGAGELLQVNARSKYAGIITDNIYTPFGSDNSGIWLGTHLDKVGFSDGLQKIAANSDINISIDKAACLLEKGNRIYGVETVTGKQFLAKYTLDCSGRHNFAGRNLKLKKELHSPSLIAWTGITHVTDENLFDQLATSFYTEENNWCWIAPEPNNRCTWTNLAKKGLADLLPPIQLRSFELLCKIKVVNTRWSIYRPLVKRGLLLCGDAGAIIDPAASQGILMALSSGIMAADCIHKCINLPDLDAFYLTGYDQWFQDQFYSKVSSLKAYYSTKESLAF